MVRVSVENRETAWHGWPKGGVDYPVSTPSPNSDHPNQATFDTFILPQDESNPSEARGGNERKSNCVQMRLSLQSDGSQGGSGDARGSRREAQGRKREIQIVIPSICQREKIGYGTTAGTRT